MTDLVTETNERVRRLVVEGRKRIAPVTRWNWFWPCRRGQDQWAALLRSTNRNDRAHSLYWFLVNQENVSPNEPLEVDLARLASEGDAVERQLACAMLWNLSNLREPSVATLIYSLEDPDPLVRDIAACALRSWSNGNIVVRMLVAIVINQFDGRNPGAVPSAELQQSAMATLISTVECCETHFRIFLSEDRRDDEMTTVMQDEYWRPLQDDIRKSLCGLAPLLNDGSSPYRADAAYCMALFGSELEPAIQALATITETNPTPEQLERLNRVCGIHGAGLKPAIPALRNCMSHADAKVRERAANTIAEMGELALPTLLKCLRDSNPGTRATSALCLSRKMGFPSNLYGKCARALPLLRDLLSDEDQDVRAAAVEALRVAERSPQDEFED